MIDYTSVRQAIEVLINEELEDVLVVFENTATEPVNVEHIEVFDETNRSDAMELGGVVQRVHGLLTITIFTTAGSGTERAREIATAVDTVLSSSDVDGLSFQGSELYSVGYTKSGHLYQHNLITPYSYFYGQDESNSC